MALASAELLTMALEERDRSPRLIHREKAGTWISDTLALASAPEILDCVGRAIGSPVELTEAPALGAGIPVRP